MKSLFEPSRPRSAFKFFRSKVKFTTGPVKVSEALRAREKINLIDVRSVYDFTRGHLPGARSLPEDQWDSYEGLTSNVTNVIYGYSVVCPLAARAAMKFANMGFPVMEMMGGFGSWKDHELPIERGAPPPKPENTQPPIQASNPDLARNYDANLDTNVNSYAPR